MEQFWLILINRKDNSDHIAYTQVPSEPLLYSVQKSYVKCGKKEINKFAPEVVTHEFNLLGSLGGIFDIIHNSQNQKHVIISSYSISWRRKELSQHHYDRIVCDEAHYFKNTKSKLFKSLVKLESTSRVLLTGTPQSMASRQPKSNDELYNKSRTEADVKL